MKPEPIRVIHSNRIILEMIGRIPLEILGVLVPVVPILKYTNILNLEIGPRVQDAGGVRRKNCCLGEFQKLLPIKNLLKTSDRLLGIGLVLQSGTSLPIIIERIQTAKETNQKDAMKISIGIVKNLFAKLKILRGIEKNLFDTEKKNLPAGEKKNLLDVKRILPDIGVSMVKQLMKV